MPFLQNFTSGIKSLFHKEQRSLEMDEELNGFLQAAAEKKMRDGLSPDQAMRAARIEMGSTETVKHKVS